MGKKAADYVRELISIQAKVRRRGPAELVRPISRRGRFLVPADVGTKDTVDVPGGHSFRQAENVSINLPEPRLGVKKLQRSFVRYASTLTMRC